jgi:hypothetical protein
MQTTTLVVIALTVLGVMTGLVVIPALEIIEEAEAQGCPIDKPGPNTSKGVVFAVDR